MSAESPSSYGTGQLPTALEILGDPGLLMPKPPHEGEALGLGHEDEVMARSLWVCSAMERGIVQGKGCPGWWWSHPPVGIQIHTGPGVL